LENGQFPRAKKKVVLSRYIVAEPKVCGGQLTFRGTRVLVADVFEQVKKGVTFDAIRESFDKAIREAAIQEAVTLAREALLRFWLPPDAARSNEEDPPWWNDDGLNWWQRFRATRKIVLGQHIIADPAICHGKLTFRGTRIFVAQALDDVASGRLWKHIEERWGGSVNQTAIAEAACLSCDALLRHWPDMAIKDDFQ
jgi:uncharacterized protein (DUF433 family)